MATEIERKFLVCDQSFKLMATECFEIRQAYLSDDPDATVRLRLSANKALITIKSRNKGLVRGEWEYEIPLSDALDIIEASGKACLIKKRYIIPAGNGLKWEVDEFYNPRAGLVLAEIELPDTDTDFNRPKWLGREVSGCTEYYNSIIAKELQPIR